MFVGWPPEDKEEVNKVLQQLWQRNSVEDEEIKSSAVKILEEIQNVRTKYLSLAMSAGPHIHLRL